MDVADKMNLEWLSREIDRNATYHNHKETMAWTATAFYIPGIIVLGHYAGRIAVYWWQYRIFDVLFLIALFLVALFISMQFRNRWLAARRVEGLIRALTRLSGGWVPLEKDWVIESKKLYPIFIEQEIPDKGQLKLDRMQTEYVT